MEVWIGILVFIAVIAVTALLFGGWVIVTVLRGVARAFGWVLGVEPAHGLPPAAPNHVRCPRARCHAENPDAARFCRRCGKPLAPAEASAPARRAAAF